MAVKITDAQKWLVLVVIVLSAYIIYRLSPILTPFLISAFLAYLGDPAVDKLETIKFSRTLAVSFVFFLMLLIGLSFLLIVVPLLEDQIRRLIAKLPLLVDWLQLQLLPWMSERFGLDQNVIEFDRIRQAIVGHWQTIGNVVAKFLVKVSASGQLLFLWISYLLLIPVVTFYLLRDWDILLAKSGYLIPIKYKGIITELAQDCDAVLSEFFRGQLLVMFSQGVFYSLGLWLVGLEFGLLIGMMAGLVSFVPYLGVIVGLSIAGIAAFMQFQDIIHIVYVLIVFGTGQVLEGMVLSPLLIGDRIGLHPVAVIFSVMAGAQLFGFFGMLIALPVAAIIVVLMRHFRGEYFKSELYSG